MEPRRVFFGLLRYRQCAVPTWRGWLVLLLAAALLGVVLVRGTYPFLAVRDPVPGGVLVVEGWAPDYALAAALAEFRSTPYEGLFVTGGPIETGAPFSEFKTYAEFGAAALAKMGAPPEKLHAVPAPPVRKDRTYASALALKRMLGERGIGPVPVNIISLGPHSRRTRMLFEEAFGPGWKVGIIPIEDQTYDANRWWASSQGFRTLTGEVIAYAYALLFFRPDAG